MAGTPSAHHHHHCTSPYGSRRFIFSLSVGWVVCCIFSPECLIKEQTPTLCQTLFHSLVSFGVSVCFVFFFFSFDCDFYCDPTTFARSTTTKIVWYIYHTTSRKKNKNKFYNEIVLSRPNGIDRRPDWNRFHFRRQQNHFNNFYRPSHEVKSNAKQFHSILNYISIQNKTNCYFYKGSRERERLLT